MVHGSELWPRAQWREEDTLGVAQRAGEAASLASAHSTLVPQCSARQLRILPDVEVRDRFLRLRRCGEVVRAQSWTSQTGGGMEGW